MKKLFKIFIHYIGTLYVRFICVREYKNQKFVSLNERPLEFSFLFRKIVEYWPKSILDVGTGATALPYMLRNCGFLVTAIDNIKDYWPSGMVNRHYHVVNDDIKNTQISETFDLITCISVLEHIQDHKAAMKSMYKLLKPGGHLILTCPYNHRKYVPNVYELPDSSVSKKFPFVTQSFSNAELKHWLADSKFELIDQEFWQFFKGDYWTCGEKLKTPINVTKKCRHQLCFMTFKRSD
jgi:2-polyprenyl-3-methyl-5-hydroxy-6-metoxy-1,4-benzoquinol methylase